MDAIVYLGPDRIATLPGDAEALRAERRGTGVGDVVIDVAYTGICGTDLLVWHGGLTRVVPPVVLGHEFVGRIADPGDSGVPVGAPIAVEPLLSCGECWACRHEARHVCRTLRLIGVDVDGGAAAQVRVPAGSLHPLPHDADLRTFALAEPTAVAVHMVHRAGLEPGQYVVVLGGGPIGALVAFVAAHRGAGSVVVSEPNDARRALLTGQGVRTVRPEELANLVTEETGGEGADLTFDVTGHPSAIAVAPEITRVRGRVLVGGLFHEPPAVPLQLVTLREQTLVGARVYTSAHMDEAIGLLAEGAIPATSLITHEVPIAEAELGAYHMLDRDRSAMKVLLRINP